MQHVITHLRCSLATHATRTSGTTDTTVTRVQALYASLSVCASCTRADFEAITVDAARSHTAYAAGAVLGNLQ